MVAVSRGVGIELLRRDGGGELRAGRVLGKVRLRRPALSGAGQGVNQAEQTLAGASGLYTLV